MRTRLQLMIVAMVAASSLDAAPLTETRTPDLHAHFSKAKVHVVNVWATWCVPCVDEMADLKAIDDAFTDSQLQLLGISLDDAVPGKREETKEKVGRFLRKHGVSFLNFYYVGGVPFLQDHYRFEGEIPLTVIYDRRGKERARYQGRIRPQVVKNDIQKLLKER